MRTAPRVVASPHPLRIVSRSVTSKIMSEQLQRIAFCLLLACALPIRPWAEAAQGTQPIPIDVESCGNALTPGSLASQLREGLPTVSFEPLFYDVNRGGPIKIKVQPQEDGILDVRLTVRETFFDVEIPINDQGIPPDRKASDGVWTSTYSRPVGKEITFFPIVETESGLSGGPRVGPAPYYNTSGYSVTKVNRSVQHTEVLINLRAPKTARRVVRRYRQGKGFTYFPELPEIMDSVTSHFGDRYDFLLIVNGGAQLSWNRSYGALMNDVRGIGREIFDGREISGLGSDTVQGTVIYPLARLFPGGFVLHHEIGHRWMVHLPPPLGLGHWPLGSLASCGIMGWGAGLAFPFHLEERNDGYELQCNKCPESLVFKPLELYLMGLIGPEDAMQSEFHFSNQNRPPAMCGDIWQGSVERLDAQRVIEEVGRRRPGVDSSKKRFRVATVVISKKFLDKESMAGLSNLLVEDARGFESATLGKGKLSVRLK